MFYKWFGSFITSNPPVGAVFFRFSGKKYQVSSVDWKPLSETITPLVLNQNEVDSMPDGGNYTAAKSTIKMYSLIALAAIAAVFVFWKSIRKLF